MGDLKVYLRFEYENGVVVEKEIRDDYHPDIIVFGYTYFIYKRVLFSPSASKYLYVEAEEPVYIN